MNNCDYKDDDKSCYFHPTEVVTGVCHMCLNEKLIVLASKQRSHLRRAQSRSFFRNHSFSHDHKPPAIGTGFPKIFAIGSLLNRFEFQHRKSDDLDFSDASSSLEDSFISIRFENDGLGSWEKNANTVSKVCLEHCNFSSWNHNFVSNDGMESTKTTVVEHVKPRGSALRWRKRIGHIFQLSKWKRSNKASVCHVGGKLEGVKVRNTGWITSLTKRRTIE